MDCENEKAARTEAADGPMIRYQQEDLYYGTGPGARPGLPLHLHLLELDEERHNRPAFLDRRREGEPTWEALARFYCALKSKVRYAEGLGWLLWNGHKWEKKDVGAKAEIADFRDLWMTLAHSHWRDALEAAESKDEQMAIKLEHALWSDAYKPDTRKALVERIQHFTNTPLSSFDMDPWALNTPQGIIPLSGLGDGEEFYGDPPTVDSLVMRSTRVTPSGACPLWQAFLDRIFEGEREMIDYIRRAAGYSLTGLTREEVLFYCFGPGANGKSKFLGALRHALGDYAYHAPAQTFMAMGVANRHATELMALAGRRFVTASEVEENSQWAEARIKELTGGDSITARGMRQDFVTFTATHKLWIAGNHLPAIQSVGEAMRRRFHLIPFEVTIPEGERDKRLAEKLEGEAAGILAWALSGGREYFKFGLNPPQKVLDASKEYLDNADTLQEWLDECTTRNPQGFVTTSVLYANYKRHTEALCNPVLGSKTFVQELKRRKFVHSKRRQGQGFEGLSLQQRSGGDEPAREREWFDCE